MQKNIVTILSTVLFAMLCVLPAQAAYPEKAISVIVPFAAGGGTDTQARLLMKYIEEKLGKPMVIVNRAGAGGEIGMTQISKAPADGYTLGVIAYPDSFIRSGYIETAYKNDDYVYIGTPVDSPVTFVVKPNSPFQDLAALVEAAKKDKKSITVGVASDAHYLAAKIFSDTAGIAITPVFFKSGAAAVNALMGGHVETQATNVQFALVAEASGAKTLAVASNKRVESLPDAKTFAEQGYDVQLKQSRIIVAPKGTPRDITDLLEKIMKEAMQNKELQARIAKVGDVFEPLTGAELQQMISTTETRLGPVVKKHAQELVSGQQ